MDLEFLQDDKKRRVAAFGVSAGFCGAALALKAFFYQLQHEGKALPDVHDFTEGRGYYENEEQLLEQLRAELKDGTEKLGRQPKVLVMGALGRCGRGAVGSVFTARHITIINSCRLIFSSKQAFRTPKSSSGILTRHERSLDPTLRLSTPISL